MRYTVVIENTGESYACHADQTLLAGMENLGKRGIPVGCRGGGCGVCKIEIVTGEVITRPMSRDHICIEDELAKRVLACRVRPASDIRLRVLGLMEKTICPTAKAMA